jgi:hypothetical protein
MPCGKSTVGFAPEDNASPVQEVLTVYKARLYPRSGAPDFDDHIHSLYSSQAAQQSGVPYISTNVQANFAERAEYQTNNIYPISNPGIRQWIRKRTWPLLRSNPPSWIATLSRISPTRKTMSKANYKPSSKTHGHSPGASLPSG